MTPLITEGLSREYLVGAHEIAIALARVLRDLDELDAGAVQRGDVRQLADVAMRDAALDDHRTVAEREPEIVQRVELEGERGLDLRAAEADVQDRHGLEHHDLSLDLPFKWDALAIPLVTRHVGHIIGAELVCLQRNDDRLPRCRRVYRQPVCSHTQT